jgi:Leucine-rich repeat (LRR) protein
MFRLINPRKRSAASYFTAAWACCGLLCVAAGCGLPTWSELIGANKQEEQLVPVQVAPPPPPPPPVTRVPPAEPPKPPDPIEVIGRFQQLRPIDIDDRALAAVLALEEGLDAITELDLKGSQVTNQGLVHLGKLSRLTRLDVRHANGLTSQALASIGTATSLEELQLDGHQIDDAGMIALRPLTELRRLNLRGARLSLAGYAELLHHPKLVELDLRDSTIDDSALDIIADLPELEVLWLARTRITDAGLARLAKLERLDTLELTDCPITGRGLADIAKNKGLRSLRVLILANTRLDEKGALSLKLFTQLKVLGLSHLETMQDVHLFQMIRTLSELEELNVSFCPLLTSEAMQAVKNHKTLKKLDLGHCPRIDDRVFSLLATCKNLRHVNVAGTNCSAVGIQRFKAILPDCVVSDGSGL